MDDELTLDGNAAAGTLAEIFGRDVTASPATCAHCARLSVVGTWRVYRGGPGTVLRCPHCAGVLLRVAERSTGLVVDTRGLAAIRIRG